MNKKLYRFAMLIIFFTWTNSIIAGDSMLGWGSVQEFKTKHGLHVMMLENHDLPIISMEFLFKNQGYATESIPGVTYLMTALLMDRSTVANPDSLYDKIEQDGIIMEFNTDSDTTRVYIETVSSKFGNAISYLNTLIADPIIQDSALGFAKGAIEAEVRHREESAFFLLSEKVAKVAFANHPYGKRCYGTSESRSLLTAKDIKKRMREVFNIADLRISIAGNIDKDSIIRQLDNLLISLSITAESKKIDRPVIRQSPHKTIRFDYDVPQTAIGFYAPGVSRLDKDFYVASVLNSALGSGLVSLLNKEVRIKHGLAYSVGTVMQERLHYSMLLGTAATKHPQETIEVIRGILESVRVNGITEQELACVKDYMINKFVMSLISNKSIVVALSDLQLYGLPHNFFSEYEVNIANVDLNSVNEFAKVFLNPENFTFVTVGR